MTTSTKGTALVTVASSGIVERDPARNRPHRLPFLFIIKNLSLLRSYLC